MFASVMCLTQNLQDLYFYFQNAEVLFLNLQAMSLNTQSNTTVAYIIHDLKTYLLTLQLYF